MLGARVFIGVLIIIGAFAGHLVGTWAVLQLVKGGWGGSTEALALICKMIGDATGALTALATMVAGWLYGSSVGGQEKDKTISTLAGKP